MKIINKKHLSLDFLISKHLVDYDKAMAFMEKRVSLIKKEKALEAIWFLEHPSIYTAGRSHGIKEGYIENVPILNTSRGGKVTWHGPGQRVIYLMIDIKKRKYDYKN